LRALGVWPGGSQTAEGEISASAAAAPGAASAAELAAGVKLPARADLRLGDSDDALAAKYVAARYEGDDPDGTLALGRRLLQEVTS